MVSIREPTAEDLGGKAKPEIGVVSLGECNRLSQSANQLGQS